MPQDEESFDQAKGDQIKETYLQALLTENVTWRERFPTEQVRTIHIGGGTPFEIGEERLFTLIDTLLETWGSETLEELTIELNPDPIEEVVAFVALCQQKYKHLYKLRFSFGIQTRDDEILQATKRGYTSAESIDFLKRLQKIKQPTTVFNLDFIAFGKLPDGELWGSREKKNQFIALVKSHLISSFSVYTLELTPGSKWYTEDKHTQTAQKLRGDDDQLALEFDLMSHILTTAGFHRYELSNFAASGKRSIHNMVYWTMQPYLGLGINASSFLPNSFAEQIEELQTNILTEIAGVRFKNTHHRKDYLAGKRLDQKNIEHLDQHAYANEKAFLALRTDLGLIYDEQLAKELFVSDYLDRLSERAEEGYLIFTDRKIALTSKGLDVYNSIITDLFQEI